MKNFNAQIGFLGYTGCGKTSINDRKLRDLFTGKYDPTIENSYEQRVYLADYQNHMIFNTFDTAYDEIGEKRNRSLIKNSDGFVIVYSITDRISFEKVREYYDRILEEKGINEFDEVDVPVVIVGNKIDLEKYREVRTEEGEMLTDELNLSFVECSAKEDIYINKLFECIAWNFMLSLDKKKKKEEKIKKIEALYHVLSGP